LLLAGASAEAQPQDLLPDLLVLRDSLASTRLDTVTLRGRVLMRFSTSVANVGQGALELRASRILGADSREVLQRIYLSDGSWRERLAGTFTFHQAHSHFHFDGWTEFRLLEATPDGGVGALVGTGIKTSFCLLDLVVHDPLNPFFPPLGSYDTCGAEFQGISPGWADVYDSSLPEQWIDVTGLAPGIYWLEVEVDPEGLLVEGDETNNLTRLQVAVGPPPPSLADRFEPNDSFAEVEAREEGGVDSPNLGLVNARREIAGLSMDDASDVFRFRMNNAAGPGDFVRIESPYRQGGDIDLLLFDAARRPIAGSFSTTNTEQVSLAGLPAGAYFIRVARFFGAVPAYTLTIEPAANTPPTIDVVAPPEEGVWIERAFETVPVRWIASDPDGDPTFVSLGIARSPELSKEILLFDAYSGLPGATGAANLNTATLPLGAWYVLAAATDGAAIVEAWAPGPFVLYVKGDVNFDGRVDRRDFKVIVPAIHRDALAPGWDRILDMDRDGDLDAEDLWIFRKSALHRAHHE
jgi:hypothetical protein